MKSFVSILLTLAVCQIYALPNFKRLTNAGNGRIIGGNEAETHQFPWQAAIVSHTNNREMLCGGSLLNKNFVLTAAACVYKSDYVDIVLGAHYLQQVDETEVRRQSKNFIIHEKFDIDSLGNNIALIKIDKDVPIVEGITEPITLATNDESGSYLEGMNATVSGWGWSSQGYSPVLRYLVSNIISNLECKSYFPTIVKDSDICVDASNGESPCVGDGGDPLTVTIDGVTKQVGILFYGSKLGCTAGYPVIYTRITSYLDWIAKNVQ